MKHGPDCCPEEGNAAPAKSFRVSKTPVAAAALAAACLGSFLWPPLVPFRAAVLSYLGMIWWAVLLGVALGGVVHRLVPDEFFWRFLARPKKRTVFYSVFLGFLGSTCSHGILALALEIHRKGASNAAVVAFLLASPWASLPLTLLLFGFFGVKAFYFVLGAMLIAVNTGLIFQVLERRGIVEKNPNTGPAVPPAPREKSVFSAGGWTAARVAGEATEILKSAAFLTDRVMFWVLVGIGIASAAAAWLPPKVIGDWMGPTAAGMIVTLVVATLVEVCSEGTSPLAFEIYRQGGAFGNAFVFLMAGVVTDISEIGLVWSNMGKRTAVFIPLVAVPQVLVLGLLANRFF